jgi:hypothetical protein
MLPIAFKLSFNADIIFIACFVANVVVHAVVDDLKANRKKINLWVDQLIHIMQIILTILIFLIF